MAIVLLSIYTGTEISISIREDLNFVTYTTLKYRVFRNELEFLKQSAVNLKMTFWAKIDNFSLIWVYEYRIKSLFDRRLD